MGIRIIAGELRGRRLEVPDLPGLRPTTDRLRETIFNILAHRIDFEGVRVLDLFAGSGALGIEGLSRGAATADFVERGGPAGRGLRRNLEQVGMSGRGRVYQGDVLRILPKLGRYDLILADPPYALPQMPDLIRLIPDHLVPGGLFMLERGHPSADLPPGPLDLIDDRAAGGTRISLYALPEK